jgi:hypothetical protein
MTGAPEQLLGHSVDEREVREYLAAYGAFPDPEVIEDDVYWQFYGSGVALLTDRDHVIQTVFLYATGHEGYSGYRGPLPLGLSHDLGPGAAAALLGEPAFSAPARQIQYLGHKGPMERYDLPTFSVHLEFAQASGKLLVVSLMTPGAVPGSDTVH